MATNIEAMHQKKISLFFLLLVSSFILPLVSCKATELTGKSKIEFVDIPGNGENVEPFQMSNTEITNQQYVDFLNTALRENKITVGKIEPLGADQLMFAGFKSRNQQCIYDNNGKRLREPLKTAISVA